MNLLSLVELDDAGVANRTANLSHTTFAFKTTTWQKDFYQDLPALSFSLSAILVDIANVTVQVYVVGAAGVVDNNTQHVERCSVKVKIQIDGWPFSKAGNMLHLSFTTHAAGGTGSVHQVPETVGEYELNPNAKLFLSHKVMHDDLWQDLPSGVSFVSETRMFGVGFNQVRPASRPSRFF